MKPVLLSFLLLAAYINQNSFAQAGKLDKTFGVNGVAKISVPLLHTGNKVFANKIVLLKDGKFLVMVAANNYELILERTYQCTDVLLYRITSDGKVDSSFANNGRKIIHSGNEEFYWYDFTIDSNNNILVTTSRENSPNGFKLLRLLPNGANDISFGKNGFTTVDLPNTLGYGTISVQPNGKILVPGKTIRTFEPPSTYLFRFTKNGTADSSFNKTGYVLYKNTDTHTDAQGDVYDAATTKPDSKILFSGTAITELKSDGTKIKNFGNNGKIYGDSTETDNGLYKEMYADVNLLPGGGFMCLSNFPERGKYADGTVIGKVYKFKSDGVPDSSLAGNGELTVLNYRYSEYSYPGPSIHHLRMQPDGKFLFFKGFNTDDSYLTAYKKDNAIFRYLPDGTIDSSFGTNGSIRKADHIVAGIVLQPDLKIVTLDQLDDSTADTSHFYLYRYKNNVNAFSMISSLPVKENIGVKSSITISPNPITGILYINGLANNTHLSIINTEGKVVAKAKSFSNNYQWNIQELMAGNYFLLAQQNDKTISVQFIKQ